MKVGVEVTPGTEVNVGQMTEVPVAVISLRQDLSNEICDLRTVTVVAGPGMISTSVSASFVTYVEVEVDGEADTGGTTDAETEFSTIFFGTTGTIPTGAAIPLDQLRHLTEYKGTDHSYFVSLQSLPHDLPHDLVSQTDHATNQRLVYQLVQ